MIKVKIDASLLKNELSMLLQQAILTRDAKNSNETRDQLAILIEKIRTIKVEIDLL